VNNKYYYKDGSVSAYYHENRVLHRADGPAIEYLYGDKFWYINGKKHREDGPAIEWANGSKWWYIEDKRHRLDGPAVEWSNGSMCWCIDGKELKEEEFNNHPKVRHYRFQALLEEVLCER